MTMHMAYAINHYISGLPEPWSSSIKAEYHANAKYENPLTISEKNSMYWSNVNVSNNGQK